jgi:hypothetical protein
LTEAAGLAALRAHLIQKAEELRVQHPQLAAVKALQALLADSRAVRFPTRLVFSAAELLPGEFAWPKPLGESPSAGFELCVHPALEQRPADLALAVAYHLVAINYLDVPGAAEAELFGATLLGLDVEDYYARLCALADELSPPPPNR